MNKAVWTKHENVFGPWWDYAIPGKPSVTWVEQIDGLFYTRYGTHAYKTLRGAQRFAERLF